MARQPRQVHIFLYRKRNNTYEYAILQRSDMPECWQGVCGGVEGNETLEDGARRELWEEAGIDDPLPLYRLESISYLPDSLFSRDAREHWGDSIIVVPMYFFAMPFDGVVRLSNEHSDVRWLPYDAAYELVYFDDQKIALYELKERLRRNKLI